MSKLPAPKITQNFSRKDLWKGKKPGLWEPKHNPRAAIPVVTGSLGNRFSLRVGWQRSPTSLNSFHWSRFFNSVQTIKSSGNTQACSLSSPPSPLPPFCGFSDEWKVLSQNTVSAISLPSLGAKLKAAARPSVLASGDKTGAGGQAAFQPMI